MADVPLFDAGRKLKQILRHVTRDKIHHKAILLAAMDDDLLLAALEDTDLHPDLAKSVYFSPET